MIDILVYLLFASAVFVLAISFFNKNYGLPLFSALLFLASGIAGFNVDREYCQYVTGWTCYTTTSVEMSFVYICGVLLVFSVVITFLKFLLQEVVKEKEKDVVY